MADARCPQVGVEGRLCPRKWGPAFPDRDQGKRADVERQTLEVLEESLLEFPGALVLVSHDRHLLDRVSTVVIGLDGTGEAGVFADYSQWEAWRDEPAPETAVARERRGPPPVAGAQKKLSYIEQREWDGMEEKILDAEQELAAWQREVQACASDPNRLPEAYQKLQDAQARVEALYARWAEMETKVALWNLP